MDIFFSALVIFFVVVDPVGLIPIYIGLVRGFDRRAKQTIALSSTSVAAAVVIFFAYFGQLVLDHLSIGIPAFRISGGALLFWIAFEMLFGKRNDRKEKAADEARTIQEARDISVFPLAIPLITGPGAITSTLLLMGRYHATVSGQIQVLAAACAIIGTTAILFLFADMLSRLLGRTLIQAVSRVLGIVLAALAAQTMLDGLVAIWPPH
ncbi:MAG: MarC family protein [Aliidongia sp.]